MQNRTKFGLVATGIAGVMVLSAPGAYADATTGSGSATATYVSSTNTMKMTKATCDTSKFTVDYKFRNVSGDGAPNTYSTITGPNGCKSTSASKKLSPGGMPFIVFRVCTGTFSCSGWVSTNA